MLRLDAHRAVDKQRQAFHTRGCIYQRRGGNVRTITEFAITAIIR
jgi:hypothetical protein